MLEQKEPKIQDKPDPSGRFVRPFHAWKETCRFIYPRYHITDKKIADKRSIQQAQLAARKGNLQGLRPGAWG